MNALDNLSHNLKVIYVTTLSSVDNVYITELTKYRHGTIFSWGIFKEIGLLCRAVGLEVQNDKAKKVPIRTVANPGIIIAVRKCLIIDTPFM